jgi:hypothetical protein
MIRSTVRSAGLALLLTMNGCGDLLSSATGPKMPGLDIAEAALQAGSGDIALHVSENYLHGSPGNIHALEIKGDALSLLGDRDGASAIFLALLAKDPASTRASIGLGRLKLGKDPATAERLFLAVLKRDPNDLTALNDLGIARDLLGKHAEAQTAYRQALAINADLESAKVNLALSMSLSGQAPANPANRVVAQAQPRLDDTVPPDVVQVPEVPAQPVAPVNRVARAAPMPVEAPLQAAVPVAPPIIAAAPIAAPPRAAVAAMYTPPPMVVRPQQGIDPDAAPPIMQPTSPVAAAMTYQRPLSLPMRAKEMIGQDVLPPDPAEDTTVVAMPPPVQHVQRTVALPIHVASAETRAPSPVSAPADRVTQVPIRIEQAPPPMLQTIPVPARADVVAPTSRTDVVALPAPRPMPRAYAARESDRAPARLIARDGSSPTVQFAAAPTEEAAHAYWRDLVRRFPKVLGQLEPSVIRFAHGGSVFWRVRTDGFGTVSEAQALCSRMRADGQDCFVPRS